MNETKRVLVVDDDANMAGMLGELLEKRGMSPQTTTRSTEALEWLAAEEIDVLVTDLNMEDVDGLELCERCRELQPDVPVVLITAFGSMESAIDAVRKGAYDYLTKPFEMPDLVRAVERALEHRALRAEVKRLRDLVGGLPVVASMIGESPAMERVFEAIARVADAETTVLLTGESGTGKELAARALHDQSRRNEHAFVAVNCAAVPATLLESELFGHARGAFTGATGARDGLLQKADGGTLFLDEIGEMPLEMQAKLLRALQERRVRPVGGDDEVPFDTRLVAATKRDLEEDVESGRFREDLFYRVNVVPIELPPLRARGNDILLLAQAFVDEAAEQADKPVTGISSEAAQRLLAYDWPGNVRELQNTMQAAVALTSFEQLVVDDLPEKVRTHESRRLTVDTQDPSVMPTLAEMERRYIHTVLDAVGGNKTAAARVLGLDRRTLYRKLERFEE